MTTEKLETYMENYLFDNFPLQENTDDTLVIDYCRDDFMSYIAYLISEPDANCLFYEYISRAVFKTKFMDCKEYTPTEIQKKQYEIKGKKLLYNFINKWWKKYTERSKVILTTQNLNEEQEDCMDDDDNHLDTDELSDEELDDIIFYVETEMIKNGEIAFVGKVSEELVFDVLDTYVTIDKAVTTDLGTKKGKLGLIKKLNSEILKLCMNKNRLFVYLVQGEYLESPKSSPSYYHKY
jgi:hypothetical protein